MAVNIRNTADSSSAQLYMAEETCWGEDPLTVSPRQSMREVRFTGESLEHTQESVASDEIRADAQVSDRVRTQVGATGDINFELSYGGMDIFFQGMNRGTWTAELDVNEGTVSPLVDVTIDPSPGTIDVVGTELDSVPVGSFVRVSGSTASPTNDGLYEVLSNTGGLLRTNPSPATTEVSNALRIQGSHLRNGTEKRSYLIEKRMTDLSPVEAQYYTGMRVGSASASITPGEIVTGTLSFLGKRGFAQNGSVGIADIAATTGDVANAVDNVQDLRLDGETLDADLTSITFDINNSTRDKPAVASLGNIDIGLGRFNATGNITAYFSNRVIYDKFLAFTAHSWSFAIIVNGEGYVFNFPSVKFTNGQILIEGNDGDIVANMDFESRRDPTLGFTFSLDRFSAAFGTDLS